MADLAGGKEVLQKQAQDAVKSGNYPQELRDYAEQLNKPIERIFIINIANTFCTKLKYLGYIFRNFVTTNA